MSLLCRQPRHRARCLAVADRIVVLKDGEMVENGAAREIVFRPDASLHADLAGSLRISASCRGFRNPCVGVRHERPLLLGSTGLTKGVPTRRKPISPPWMASIFSSNTARRWRWSARPAAASRRSRAWSCGILEPDAGTLHFGGEDLLALRGARLRAMRERLQMVFQDPLAAFNPARHGGTRA